MVVVADVGHSPLVTIVDYRRRLLMIYSQQLLLTVDIVNGIQQLLLTVDISWHRYIMVVLTATIYQHRAGSPRTVAMVHRDMGLNELHTWRRPLRPPKPLVPPLLEMEMWLDSCRDRSWAVPVAAGESFNQDALVMLGVKLVGNAL